MTQIIIVECIFMLSMFIIGITLLKGRGGWLLSGYNA